MDSNLYENGSVISLLQEKPTGYIASVFAAGSDIYVAGSDSVGDAVGWKNRQMHVVEQGYYPTHSSGSDPSVFCLFVSGTDVYMGGLNASDTAVYWKYGLATPVLGSTSINALLVSGSDLYFTGYITGACKWWNQCPCLLEKMGWSMIYRSMALLMGNATSILVSGSDGGVTGETSEGAVYWKNGVEIILSSAGTANDIYVQ